MGSSHSLLPAGVLMLPYADVQEPFEVQEDV